MWLVLVLTTFAFLALVGWLAAVMFGMLVL